MNYNKEAKSLTFRKGSEVSQVVARGFEHMDDLQPLRRGPPHSARLERGLDPRLQYPLIKEYSLNIFKSYLGSCYNLSNIP